MERSLTLSSHMNDEGRQQLEDDDAWSDGGCVGCEQHMAHLSKALTTNLFLGGVFSPVPFLPFFFFSLPSLSLSSPPWRGPSNPVDWFREALSAPQWGRKTFAATRHVSWAPNTQKKCVCGRDLAANSTVLVYLEPSKRVWWLQMLSYFC